MAPEAFPERTLRQPDEDTLGHTGEYPAAKPPERAVQPGSVALPEGMFPVRTRMASVGAVPS